MREIELKLLDNQKQVKVTCNDPFFDFLVNAQIYENAQKLSFQTIIPFSCLKELCIRASYLEIAASIKVRQKGQSFSKAIVTGTEKGYS